MTNPRPQPNIVSKRSPTTTSLISRSLQEIAGATDPAIVEGILANAQRLAVAEVIAAATEKLANLAPEPRRRRAGTPQPSRRRPCAWGPEVPNTHPGAKPVATAPQSGGRVIYVENAQYRGCTFSGYVELSGEDPFFHTARGLRAFAKILWFGNQLPTRDPGVLLVNAVITETAGYSGPVISNLAA